MDRRHDDELRNRIGENAWRVTQENSTEPPFANEYWDNHEKGLYIDVISGDILFSSDDKFDSGCGWPSFTQPFTEKSITTKKDTSHGMNRTEVRSATSGGHLGHVFDDGPHPGGLRYCVNSASLRFIPFSKGTAVLAAGCFWGTEAYFRRIDGVLSVETGYSGGTTPNPGYEEVCSGSTGHAEAVRIRFDPERVSYRDILRHFFRMHDPTTLDRQGNDVGAQYRSEILYTDDEQRLEAERVIAELDASGRYDSPVVTKISALNEFWLAEDYHQDYLGNHPGGYCHVDLSLAGRPLEP